MNSPRIYRKKPVVIEAIQFVGSNTKEVAYFLSGGNGTASHAFFRVSTGEATRPSVDISTPEGVMTALPQDFIIKGVRGEFYPCRPDIFRAAHEEVEDAS